MLISEQCNDEIKTNNSNKNQDGKQEEELHSDTLTTGALEIVKFEDLPDSKDWLFADNDSNCSFDSSYKCELCGESFGSIEYLVLHIKMRTGEQPDELCEESQSKFRSGFMANYEVEIKSEFIEEDIKINYGDIHDDIQENSDINNTDFEVKKERCEDETQPKSEQDGVVHSGLPSSAFEFIECEGTSALQNPPYIKTETSGTSNSWHKCDFCAKSFTAKASLANHIKVHAGQEQQMFLKSTDLSQTSENLFECNVGGEPTSLDQFNLKNRFNCEFCEKHYTKRSHLNDHVRLHTGEKPHKCKICNQLFSRKSSLLNHSRVHSGEKPFKCNLCDKMFTQRSSLSKHKKLHTGERSHKCDVCGKAFSEKSYLVQHIRTHTGEKPYKCDFCDQRFTQKGTQQDHIKLHSGEKPHKCEICDKTFSKKKTLVSHSKLHTGRNLYNCDICDKKFTQKHNLTNHIRAHTGEKLYTCDICGKSYAEKRSLESHIKFHTGESPYECHFCDKKFRQEKILKVHLKLHTGEKPYKCKFCEDSFSQKHYLESHIQIHAGAYKCHYCERKFTQRAKLERHIISHSQEKQHECDICEKSFKYGDDLKKHRRIQHASMDVPVP